MTALPSELARLFHVATPATQQSHDPSQPLTTADGQVRCAVLELARPADWDALGAVWHEVQADLALPAPAIAVNGVDGYQLWFSWQQPLPAAEASHFVQLLCQRYLPAVDPLRLRCYPGVDLAFPAQVPAPQGQDGQEGRGQGAQWSAFLASDLAGVFADEPWLDRHPGQDAQAQLLARLSSMPAQDYAKALQRLQPVVSTASPVSLIDPSVASPLPHPPSPEAPAASAAPTSPHANYPTQTPTVFLQAVMQDPAAPLALRVKAAAALLQTSAAPRG